MFTKMDLLKTTGAVLFSMATMPVAHAQSSTTVAATAPVNYFQQCATQNSIQVPAPGSGEKLTSEQWSTIHSCIRTERHAARLALVNKCETSNGITPPTQGQSLTAEQNATVQACVQTAKKAQRAAYMAARKAAFAQCASTAGFTPGEGQKPTDEQHQTIRSCMHTAGFFGHHGHRHAHRWNQGSGGSSAVST